MDIQIPVVYSLRKSDDEILDSIDNDEKIGVLYTSPDNIISYQNVMEDNGELSKTQCAINLTGGICYVVDLKLDQLRALVSKAKEITFKEKLLVKSN